MTEQNGAFPKNTVIARCELELGKAQSDGQFKENVDVHMLRAYPRIRN